MANAYFTISGTLMTTGIGEREDLDSIRLHYLENLQQTIQANLQTDTPVEDFVHHIWGTPRDTIDAILGKDDWAIDPRVLTRYQNSFPTRRKVFTPRPHKSFRSICAGLLNDVYDFLGLDSRDVEDEFVDGMGKQYLDRDGDGAGLVERDPDFVRVWKKKGRKGQRRNREDGDGPVEWEDVKAFVEFSSFKTVETYADRRHPFPLHLPVPHEGDPSTELSSNEDTSSKFEMPTKKRRRLSFAETMDQELDLHYDYSCRSARPFKRIRLSTTLTPDHLRFSSYAVECLGTLYADRQYVTGIFVDLCQVSLWYFDRHLVLRTAEFDFSTPRGMGYLALTLFALAQCDMQHAGFDPLVSGLGLTYPNPEPEPHRRCQGMMRGREMTVHSSSSEAESKTRLEKLQCPYFNPQEYCISFPNTPDRFWAIDDWIDRFVGIIGHGTTTLLVRECIMDGDDDKVSRSQQVLKYQWLAEGSLHEEDILETMWRRMGKSQVARGWEKHLPIKASFLQVYSAGDLGVPWTRMQLPNIENLDSMRKELHVSVGKNYRHLWEVGNAQQFKRVFLDCLECHHHAYQTGGVLHGAISEQSLRVGYSESNELIGILTNWEVGLTPREENDIPLLRQQDTGDGTGPFGFAATELVRQDKQCSRKDRHESHHRRRGRERQHYYRHDLESFFYILVWACVQYNFEFGHRDSIPPTGGLGGWLYKGSAWYEKMTLLMDDERWGMIEEMVKSEMKEVFEAWVVPLRWMFKRGLMSLELYGEEDAYDAETCDGYLTFETFMMQIGEEPRRKHRPSAN